MWLGCSFLISYPRINYINVSTTGWPLASPMTPGTVTRRALRSRSKACFRRWKMPGTGQNKELLMLRSSQTSANRSFPSACLRPRCCSNDTPSTSKEASFWRRTDVPSPLAPCLLLLTYWLLEQIYPGNYFILYLISVIVCNDWYILLKYLVSTQRTCIPCWNR